MEHHFEALRRSYDAVAEDYANQFFEELAHKPLDRALLTCFADEVAGMGPIADVGCGPGQIARFLHDRGLAVTGIDLSPRMVELARRRSPAITFREGSVLALPSEDASWAGITAFYSIIHLPRHDVGRSFGEMYRVLTPGGLLLLAFHLGEGEHHLGEWWGKPVDIDAYFHGREPIESRLRDEGFTVEAVVERQPRDDIEYPSRRCYLFARKPRDG